MESVPHIRIEYDLGYADGERTDVGEFAYVPEEAARQPGGIEAAFERILGHPRESIVHYTLDELYDEHGKRLSEDAPRP